MFQGGKNILFAKKAFEKILYSPKNVEKQTIWPARRGRGKGGQEQPFALPCRRPWKERYLLVNSELYIANDDKLESYPKTINSNDKFFKSKLSNFFQ